jgi:hypothetical protein
MGFFPTSDLKRLASTRVSCRAAAQHSLKRVSLVSVLFLFLVFAAAVSGQVDMRSHGFRVLVFGWMLFGIVMLTLTHEVRCPRCGQRFYAKGAEFWQMTKTCLHCGQLKYADVNAATKPGNEGRCIMRERPCSV